MIDVSVLNVMHVRFLEALHGSALVAILYIVLLYYIKSVTIRNKEGALNGNNNVIYFICFRWFFDIVKIRRKML